MGQDSQPITPPVVAIVGPTAVGKSHLALELAQRLPADIVTADSRQVYRYMDIGTAKPTREERVRARHFMIDLIEPNRRYSAKEYRDEGRRVLRRIAARGRIALVVGGTGFYVRALLDGIMLPDAPPNHGLRARLREEAERSGPETLHRRLRELDPASAARVHPNNVVRVIRALEVIDCLGGPVPTAAAGVTPDVPGPPTGEQIPALYLGLSMNRERLRRAADRRVTAQVAAGLVEETRLLLTMGYGLDCPPMQGFGYRHMAAYLEGRCGLQDAVQEYQTATHQYIRRQMTWFRADSRNQWLVGESDAVLTARRLIEEWIAHR
ncbi:MAG: tRNA (adenosine(37)-N6)-dimethylallyltransferase MiaA [Chloroflexi bacterium]|nr:tRNA (adenosine(37)-N6)-dimethylallyltransferase MiaA [Chloroflexota bacterium]